MNYPDPVHSRPSGKHNEMPSTKAANEPKTLLPTKIYSYPNSNINHGKLSVGGSTHEAYPTGAVRWGAKSVVEWVESLSAATESAEAQAALEKPQESGLAAMSQPLSINSTLMSTPSVVPPAAPWASHSGADPRMNPSNPTPLPEKLPKLWNPDHVHSQDPWAWIYTGEILTLAQAGETLFAQKAGLCDEQRTILARLDFLVGRIVGQSKEPSLEAGETRMLLDRLYQNTIQKLNTSIESTRRSGLKGTGNSSSGKAAHEQKKDLSLYMTEWLQANWTNPYPDDDGLAEMANECGTSKTVVSNWLINARTRKWRPAIVKAVEQNRPADCLLEDSQRIFAGERLAVPTPPQHRYLQQTNPPKRVKSSAGVYHHPNY